jgi:hypothetical protein
MKKSRFEKKDLVKMHESFALDPASAIREVRLFSILCVDALSRLAFQQPATGFGRTKRESFLLLLHEAAKFSTLPIADGHASLRKFEKISSRGCRTTDFRR